MGYAAALTNLMKPLKRVPGIALQYEARHY